MVSWVWEGEFDLQRENDFVLGLPSSTSGSCSKMLHFLDLIGIFFVIVAFLCNFKFSSLICISFYFKFQGRPLPAWGVCGRNHARSPFPWPRCLIHWCLRGDKSCIFEYQLTNLCPTPWPRVFLQWNVHKKTKHAFELCIFGVTRRFSLLRGNVSKQGLSLCFPPHRKEFLMNRGKQWENRDLCIWGSQNAFGKNNPSGGVVSATKYKNALLNYYPRDAQGSHCLNPQLMSPQ